MREYNFDGLVGLTHNYAGLSRGNLASAKHGGWSSNPKAAALQGLEKMRAVAALGIGQALLPPQVRPDVETLRALGFSGSDAEVIQGALTKAPELLTLCSSASSMWTANAATVCPSSDSSDGRVHLTVANLAQMFHRQIEAQSTTATLRRIFSDRTRFNVNGPLPPSPTFGDEGAANHTRLHTEQGSVHLFAWGRTQYGTRGSIPEPTQHPARQTLEASRAVARLNHTEGEIALFWQQSPCGIDAGAFHTDVLAVGNANFLMLHEKAFVNTEQLLAELKERLGPDFCWCLASEKELPSKNAVTAYPFNSQLVSLPTDPEQAPGMRPNMAIIAPSEARDDPATAQFLERVVSEDNPVTQVKYLDVRQSMANGGGPACLRLRVQLTSEERAAIASNVFWSDTLHKELITWVEKYYRDRLTLDDLADPQLLTESNAALSDLNRLLKLR